jgi:2-polyprenyl-3-methyl-5-hydroxy-6-metoxy-1,4-benzoquinol methylase
MSIIKFSKPSIAVIKNKTSFFEQNEKHLNLVKSVNDVYKMQEARNECKTCSEPLGDIDLIIHEVPYSICENCKHLNGRHDDSKEFAEFLYADSDGEEYSQNYLNNYNSRVEDIYMPKAEFLQEVLNDNSINKFSVTDIGCGGGHFVKACENFNIDAVGYDVNKNLIELGSKILKKNKIIFKDLDLINDLIRSTSTEVLSLVGVLEHLMDPQGALKAFTESDANYLYLQVPLFSFAAIQESMHDDVFPRQLNAGHTHLYTKESLDFLCKKFSLEKAGEWWFGTDMVDLFRHLHIKVQGSSEKKADIIQTYFGDYIDEFQKVIDKEKICSGVNLVLKKH